MVFCLNIYHIFAGNKMKQFIINIIIIRVSVIISQEDRE